MTAEQKDNLHARLVDVRTKLHGLAESTAPLYLRWPSSHPTIRRVDAEILSLARMERLLEKALSH